MFSLQCLILHLPHKAWCMLPYPWKKRKAPSYLFNSDAFFLFAQPPSSTFGVQEPNHFPDARLLGWWMPSLSP